ncbi:MAG: hypothetical protein PGN16_13755 [Sphingomonas phyllosphaerae]|uniref:hypothetical protein n=1 Tax=Sphingomonas phyllosphaerae TaxID=257003 RepID=UPI002FF76BE6
MNAVRLMLSLSLAGSLVTTPTAALAEDDTAKTGVIAALGVEAAGGKSTIAGGAGAIEAGVLASDAMLRAGAVVASLANRGAAGGRVLVVSRDQQVSLSMVRVVRDRIQAVRDLVARTPCPKPPKTPPPAEPNGVTFYGLRITPGPVTPFLSDIAGAIATDTTINPVAFAADDRVLVNAIVMGRTETRYALSGAEWISTDAAGAADPPGDRTDSGDLTRSSFFVPGEIADVGDSTPTRTAYDAMLREVDAKRGCSGDAIKGAVATADALATSLNASEKGATSPLVTAMQLDQLLGTSASGTGSTYLLRVAVEQTGGTAISRAGIVYTLGFPGASVVSAGVLVSFRLIQPRTGAIVMAGVVRCAVPQTRFSKVRDTILRNADRTACSYRAG